MSFTPFEWMVSLHELGIIIMPLLTENQLADIVDMFVDDYGSRLAGGEISEIAGITASRTASRTHTFIFQLALPLAGHTPSSFN